MTFDQSDDPVVVSTLTVIQSQKSTLLGIGGVFARLAWSWFTNVVGSFVVSWIIDIIVLVIAGWTVVQLVEWLKSRLTKVSNVVSGSTFRSALCPQYIAYRDAKTPSLWRVKRVDGDRDEATFPDGEEKAKAYARLLNSGMPLC